MSTVEKVPLKENPNTTTKDNIYPSLPPPYSEASVQEVKKDDPANKSTTEDASSDEEETTPVVLPMVIPAENAYGSQPSRVTCKSCHEEMVTTVKRTPICRTHIMAILFCVIGCWPCAILPYTMDVCKNADHYCTKCDTYIGTYTI